MPHAYEPPVQRIKSPSPPMEYMEKTFKGSQTSYKKEDIPVSDYPRTKDWPEFSGETRRWVLLERKCMRTKSTWKDWKTELIRDFIQISRILLQIPGELAHAVKSRMREADGVEEMAIILEELVTRVSKSSQTSEFLKPLICTPINCKNRWLSRKYPRIVEQVIMEFICRSRTQPSYSPNTRHVFYRLDADLIRLSLATHEPHFKVLREDVFSNERRRKECHLCRPMILMLSRNLQRGISSIELKVVGTSFKFELKHAIDNWIREGAIDCLLKIWKTNLAMMGGYLTDCGQLGPSHTKIILEGWAVIKEEIFRKPQEAEERQDHIFKRLNIKADSRQKNMQLSHNYYPQSLPSSTGSSSLAPDIPFKPSFSPTGSESIIKLSNHHHPNTFHPLQSINSNSNLSHHPLSTTISKFSGWEEEQKDSYQEDQEQELQRPKPIRTILCDLKKLKQKSLEESII
ncbi:hypothetical protein PPACK8108_LOCUS13316 [Phakopsora pachyrhizi]|uniref:Uncharacterized protein n=1 Tax=Phakopsora pachyrhizi TaxID=170000 RepID=A0AAV0B5I2_PHAPC|nr:hypothetical protein PPACK8108_LOCUS13316 [Phakopsora pachyrhizi]